MLLLSRFSPGPAAAQIAQCLFLRAEWRSEGIVFETEKHTSIPFTHSTLLEPETMRSLGCFFRRSLLHFMVGTIPVGFGFGTYLLWLDPEEGIFRCQKLVK